jgi:hypothetical protein
MFPMVMDELANTGNIQEAAVMLVDSTITGSISTNTIQATLERQVSI